MSTRIQVTGLPRCGSAFIATMLNLNPRCIAYHDLISTHEYWRETLSDAWEKYDYVADCGTYQFLPKASDPRSVKVFIDRRAEDSRVEAEQVFGYKISPIDYSTIAAISEDWVAENKPLVVNFASLWNVRSMETIWDHVFGGDVKFPSEKVEMLLLNDIQRREPEKAFALDSLSARVRELF